MWKTVVSAGCRQWTHSGKIVQRLSIHTSPICNKLSDFQVKKITHEFDNILDRNKDGFIDKPDIEAFKRKLREYVTQWPGKKPGDKPYKAGYDDYWILFQELADTNKDGQLSRDEWIELWTKINESAVDRSFKSLPQWVRLLPNSMFQVMDYKEDGVIDVDEYKNFWYQVAGYPVVSDTQLKKCLHEMTQGGVYVLDLNRVEDLYADFYLSPDSSTPGKYIAGPVHYD